MSDWLLQQASFLDFLCCIAMTSLIWMVQILLYPNFKLIPKNSWQQFHHHHSSKISFIVAPLMSLELICSCVNLFQQPSWLQTFTFVTTIITWLATLFISVPLHRKLSKDFDLETIQQLIHTNWIRTIAWSSKSILLMASILT